MPPKPSVHGCLGGGASTITDVPGEGNAVLNEVYSEIARCLEQGLPVAVATVTSARGSTPRKPGAKMAIKPDGSFCGTIGGGCGEAEVRRAAAQVLETGVPQVVQVDLTEPIDGPDRTCGGVMEVFVERIHVDERVV